MWVSPGRAGLLAPSIPRNELRPVFGAWWERGCSCGEESTQEGTRLMAAPWVARVARLHGPAPLVRELNGEGRCKSVGGERGAAEQRCSRFAFLFPLLWAGGQQEG